VLLVHGWPQHWYMWRHLLGPLADAGYRAIAPDLRGFGWSEHPPDEDFRKETLVDDLIALCDELALPRVAYVGHDWGCWAGWLLCLRRPDLVERAVLMSAPPPFPPDRIDLAALGRIGRLWYQLPISLPLPARAKAPYFRALGRTSGADPADFAAFDAALSQPAQVRASTLLYRQFQLRELGPLIARRYAGRRSAVPIRFMIGERDLLLYEGLAEQPAPHCDDYSGEVLPGIAHFVPEEAPDLVRERLLSFLPEAQGSVPAPR
jgi:pimeloyl-ACP methyl ester carboxylesterase